MDSLELIVVVAVAVLLMGRLSRRTGLSEPLLLLAVGAVVGLTPSFASFALSPDVVLFLFLPALLYWEALTSSVREIRNNFRSIALQSTGLVLATAVAVAAVAHALGYGWPIAFVLGAVLAPTDAAAVAAVDEALAVGIRPGLSIDVEVALASDLFTQMRALLAIQRMRAVNAAYGTGGELSRITTHDVLDFATLQGARTNGLGDVTGSLTPGKKADLLVVQAEDLNNMPLNDPIGTLVLGSDARNITAVFVNGQPRKWDGQVLDVNLPELRAEVSASRDHVLNTPVK
jgi:hypothetical protein